LFLQTCFCKLVFANLFSQTCFCKLVSANLQFANLQFANWRHKNLETAIIVTKNYEWTQLTFTGDKKFSEKIRVYQTNFYRGQKIDKK
jgi:uncharacterized protein YjbI with pentapeptide repeats